MSEAEASVSRKGTAVSGESSTVVHVWIEEEFQSRSTALAGSDNDLSSYEARRELLLSTLPKSGRTHSHLECNEPM